jgi:exopolyphosphatase/guanosine-5'-triphosphate,3'-diphosphate pyrophosphatase
MNLKASAASAGMNVAALDLGSNSFGLLVGRVRRDGRVEKLGTKKEALRIGEVVACHGAIPDTSFERALGVVGEMLGVAHELDAEHVAAVGTSALRDAANGPDFVRAAAERLGLPIQIVSGDEEARLVYHGARSALEDLPERSLVIDLGGSSVELAVGDGSELLSVDSLPLGFLRVARELDLGATTSRADVARISAHVREAAERVIARLVAFSPRALVASGGTARALGRVASALGVRELTGVGLRRLGAHLALRDPSHLAVLGVEASRAPVFGVGIVVLAALVELTQAPVMRISAGGLREGVILREAKNRKGREPSAGRAAVRTWAA